LEGLPRLFREVKILLLAKTQGLTEGIEPFVNRLRDTGMWISEDIRWRMLALAGEGEE
jgi:predicted nucleic acid-binding protein